MRTFRQSVLHLAMPFVDAFWVTEELATRLPTTRTSYPGHHRGWAHGDFLLKPSA